jgi:hypothetical protein
MELIIKCEYNSVNPPTRREVAPLLPVNGHIQLSQSRDPNLVVVNMIDTNMVE